MPTKPNTKAKPEKSQFQHLLDSFLVESDIPESLHASFPNIKIQQRFIPGICRFAPPSKISKFSTFNTRANLIKWVPLEKGKNTKFGMGTIQYNNGTIEEKKVFVKTIHLLDPFTFVKGDYGSYKDGDEWMPTLEESYEERQKKLNSMYNQAYIDATAQAVLSRLKEENMTPHALLSYGMVVGTHKSYWYDITNDFESLRARSWFWDAIGDDGKCLKFSNNDGGIVDSKLEDMLRQKPEELYDSEEDYCTDSEEDMSSEEESEEEAESEEDMGSEEADEDSSENTSEQEKSITEEIDDQISACDLDDLPVTAEADLPASAAATACLPAEADVASIASADSVNILNITRISNNTQTTSHNILENHIGVRVQIECKNMPVLLLFQEAADGTMEELLEEEESVLNSLLSPGSGDEGKTGFSMSDSIENMSMLLKAEKDERWSAWLLQIIAGLSQLQALISFCHNDLHTNNIVWTKTPIEYLYYKRTNGDYYKVPTYGKLFHLIDYGRATFSIGDRMFISDDFFDGNDAFGQYNYGACFTPDRPVLYPNMSFDLCRLAVSLLDSLYDSTPTVNSKGQQHILNVEGRWKKYETSSDLYNTIWKWLIDNKGKNVLRTEDGEDRFPGFDLYVHIAKNVHKAVPKEQWNARPFNKFKTSHPHPAALKVYN